jgi:hypothetical protein
MLLRRTRSHFPGQHPAPDRSLPRIWGELRLFASASSTTEASIPFCNQQFSCRSWQRIRRRRRAVMRPDTPSAEPGTAPVPSLEAAAARECYLPERHHEGQKSPGLSGVPAHCSVPAATFARVCSAGTGRRGNHVSSGIESRPGAGRCVNPSRLRGLPRSSAQAGLPGAAASPRRGPIMTGTGHHPELQTRPGRRASASGGRARPSATTRSGPGP